jgi:hypothetical protein
VSEIPFALRVMLSTNVPDKETLLRFVPSDKSKVVPAHVMKAYRRTASMAPLILNLGIS